MIKNLIQGTLRTMGVQLTDYPKQSERRQLKIIGSRRIDTILDIGANTGQYGQYLRSMGYKGKIISFEPMKAAFAELEKKANKDSGWVAMHYALGNDDGTTTINVSGNSQSSSILEMLPSHEKSAPSSKYVTKEEIEIKKLDTIFDSICDVNDKVMLKVDTQGFEKSVLDGAERSLDRVAIIELELSLVPLYENPILYIEMIDIMKEKGFELQAMEHVFSDATTGQTLQVDGTFVRKS
ncbi:FkbM family methyltransferase [Maribacter sp.]|nr:FkbM family methyltransferase [Maribacter sp.]